MDRIEIYTETGVANYALDFHVRLDLITIYTGTGALFFTSGDGRLPRCVGNQRGRIPTRANSPRTSRSVAGVMRLACAIDHAVQLHCVQTHVGFHITLYPETALAHDATDSHVYVDVVAVHAETGALSFASGNGCLRSDT